MRRFWYPGGGRGWIWRDGQNTRGQGRKGQRVRKIPYPDIFFEQESLTTWSFFQEFRTITRRFAHALLLMLHTEGRWKMAGIWDGGSNLEEYDLRMRLISYIFRNVSRLIELRWYCCTDFGNTKWSNALNHCKSKHNSRRRSLPNKLALKTEVFMAIMLRDCAKIHTCIFLSSANFVKLEFLSFSVRAWQVNQIK